MSDISTVLGSFVRADRLFHAYIISGSSDGARLEAAKYIAKTAVCVNRSIAPCGICSHCQKVERDVHPDITYVRREKDARELTVDAIREVRSAAYVVPTEAERSVFIICDADTMNVPAQNALLKILEEPPEHAVFVLLADNQDRLLQTVRSRCEKIIIPPESISAEIPQEALNVTNMWIKGDKRATLEAVMSLEKLDRNQLLSVIAGMREEIISLVRKGRTDGEKAEGVLNTLDKCEKYMSVNVSSGYIAGMIMTALL